MLNKYYLNQLCGNPQYNFLLQKFWFLCQPSEDWKVRNEKDSRRTSREDSLNAEENNIDSCVDSAGDREIV